MIGDAVDEVTDITLVDLRPGTGDRQVHEQFGAERASGPLASGVETKEELAQLRRDAEAEGFGIGKPHVLDGNLGYFEFKRFLRAERW